MPKLIYALIVCLCTASAFAFAADIQTSGEPITATQTNSGVPASSQMEKDLQHLNWKQFKSVVEAVPKLKADVEAYGPLGWQYVQANYANYGWKKNIDKLDDTQKKQLAELIKTAKDSK